MPRKEQLQTVLPIVGAAFLLRMFFVGWNYHSLAASEHFEAFGAEMGWTARSLAQGQGFSSPFFPRTGPTALIPPIYPFLLAGIFRLFGVYTNASAFVALALNSLLSSLTAAVIFFGARHRLDTRQATGAAWLWALYPYSVFFSAVYLWDFALTSLLFTSCFFLATNTLSQMRVRGWAGYGILAGLACLSNPSVLPLLLLLTLYAAWQRIRFARPFLTRMLLAGLCMTAVLSPWVIRNFRVFHQPVVLRDGFWGEFYAGNSGDTSRTNVASTHPASNAHEMLRYEQLGETGYMNEKRTLSIERVRTHPGQFLGVTLRRIVRYWTGYWSFSRQYLAVESFDIPNVPLCTLLTLLMVIGVRALWRTSRTAALPYVVSFLVFPLPYYVTHASIDYRQPIEPLVVVTVMCGSVWLRNHLTRDFMARKVPIFASGKL